MNRTRPFGNMSHKDVSVEFLQVTRTPPFEISIEWLQNQTNPGETLFRDIVWLFNWQVVQGRISQSKRSFVRRINKNVSQHVIDISTVA